MIRPCLFALGFAVTKCTPLSLKPAPISRRGWMAKSLASTSAALLDALRPPSAVAEADGLPSDLKKYTVLAPLGAPSSTGSKLSGLSLAEIASRLSRDLVEGSTGKGGYFISGDISTQLFRDDCEFTDPTNTVSSLSRYQNALQILFDPENSFVQLLEPLKVDESRNVITARIRSGGVLKLPWKPYISPYESTIEYHVDENGLIDSQVQDWSISASEALRETFTPSSLGAPYSNLSQPQNEPEEVTELFDLVNGHRPDLYSQEARFRIASLIDRIADAHYEWHDEDLIGKWALAYLQPGPDGGGIDRRIPFPDLPFNNNYQIFSADAVTNIGELLGPLLEVRVGGSLREEDVTSHSTPKRFRANIDAGGLCLGESDEKCLPLPISGEGIFDGVYLGKRLRIGQNINGGGARVVQVKVA
ncbi:hypothetical protein ACHAWF_005398 [Thalassiosira exigua]